MATSLVIVIEQDSADFDQLGHLAMGIESDIRDGNDQHGSGLHVKSMTMMDEFGGLVTRFEPNRTIFVHEGDLVTVQRHG